MSLLTAELRKVWGNRVFPMLLAVLVAANLLLLWMGTRPTANQPPAAAYRAVGADLAALGSDMAAKGDFLHGKLDETESLLRLENYYRDLAYGNSVTLQYYREQNADLFDAWEQTYLDKTYTLYTDSLSLPDRHARLDAHPLGGVAGGQHDAVAVLLAAADGDAFAAQGGVFLHFDRGIKRVGVDMEYGSARHTRHPLWPYYNCIIWQFQVFVFASPCNCMLDLWPRPCYDKGIEV